jgi:excisionase family DNA binding protein
MSDLLTARQLQDMLKVDRVTIYRMLEDGRLQGFKVGGQWRFSRNEIESWIESQRQTEQITEPFSDPNDSQSASCEALPVSCLQGIQGILAEACDVAAVTISKEGIVLTKVSHPCAFCQLILSSDEGQKRCLGSWRSFQKLNGASSLMLCHAGLQYMGQPVKVSGQTIAVLLTGQFITKSFPTGEQDMHLQELSQACNLDLFDLQEMASRLPVRNPEQIEHMSRVLKHTANTLAEIGLERSRLLKRLQKIAKMTVLD